MTWMILNIIRFVFMTTREKVITIPTSVRDIDECNDYFLMIKGEIYQNFVSFWTQHQRFSRTCSSQTCSRVFIVDGHQKANRLVCQFKNVFDSTIPEMGSVQVGCLYSPLRKGPLVTMNSLQSHWFFLLIANGVDHRFCQHHQPSTTTSIQNRLPAPHEDTEENKEEVLDKLALVEYVDKQGHYDDALCNVFRSGLNSKSKISTYGFLATFLNCSVLVGFTEQPCSEGSTC
jgi:hypothetical protein